RFGPSFKKPSRKTVRLHRAKKGSRMFEAEEVRHLLAAAGQPLKAMLLLGVNCGFGNNDVATLPLSALDLEGGGVNQPRPKTGIARRAKLWAETAAALREVLTRRPAPKDEAHSGLVFITKYGGIWAGSGSDSPVSKEMRKLLDRLGINGSRNFYALR